MPGKRNTRKAERREARQRFDERLEQYNQQLKQALALIEGEEADAVVGKETPNHETIARAGGALVGSLWHVALTRGIETDQETRQVWARSAAIAVDLVHRAYALGIKEQQRRSRDERDLDRD